MSHRGQLLSPGRLAAAAAAVVIVAGLVNCAAFPPSARDGTLGTALAPTAPKTKIHERVSRGAILAAAPGTYIDQILEDRDSTIERWSNRLTQPLRVWIDSSDTIGGAQAGYPAAVRAAFTAWASTGIPLRVVYVAGPGEADIRVRWTEHLNHKTGSTTWRTDHNGWMLAGDITLATHISDGQPLDARGMRAIALHETGHALGLSHSTDPTDIMAGLVRVDELSAADRSTIRLVYSLSAGPVN